MTGFIARWTVSLLCIGAVACGNGGSGSPDAAVDSAPPVDAMVAPALRNPVDLPDTELATEALRLLGSSSAGGTKNCNACHGLTRQYLRHWRALSDQSLSMCLTDLSVATPALAREMIDCLRDEPGDTASPYQAHKLGIYSTASHLQWFEFLFWRAHEDGADPAWEDEFSLFQDRVAMPKGEQPRYTQPELDIVAEWFARGVPQIDAILPNDPPPTDCTPGVSADVTSHVADMALTGWRSVNQDNNILMFGCASAATALDCLSSFSRAGDTEFGVGWESMPGAKLRVLRTNDYRSAFWTRSSADGRFVGHGTDNGSAIIDLLEDRVIPTNAFYDPGFFPDNSAFMFQRFQAHICNQSLLTSSPTQINYNEPECDSTNAVGLYQHVGSSLGGGDYWAVDGQFVSDDGGHDPTLSDPSTSFDSTSEVTLTPMIHTGNSFDPVDRIDKVTPFEGDAVLSPSAELLVSRLTGPGDKQLGFVMRRLIATPTPGGYSVEAPEVARYCVNGGKPGFSYDERWMAIHHYVDADDAVDLGFSGANDPGFAPYLSSGAANIYLIDLLTGAQTRVTNMSPGQYALFPHFRSDGWIYFDVRVAGTSTEHIVASDAALVVESTE